MVLVHHSALASFRHGPQSRELDACARHRRHPQSSRNTQGATTRPLSSSCRMYCIPHNPPPTDRNHNQMQQTWYTLARALPPIVAAPPAVMIIWHRPSTNHPGRVHTERASKEIDPEIISGRPGILSRITLSGKEPPPRKKYNAGWRRGGGPCVQRPEAVMKLPLPGKLAKGDMYIRYTGFRFAEQYL